MLLAAAGGESNVQPPGSGDEYPPDRQHPLHVKVHLKTPGTHDRPGTIFVAIGDDGELTADAITRCDGQFVNAP
ncbi:MAG TPA: hypothetical protein VMM13_07780 [Euzebya sp.]|nr:hypothetical protein [Euzebya sp.]